MLPSLSTLLPLLWLAPTPASDPDLIGTWVVASPHRGDPFEGTVELSARGPRYAAWLAGENFISRPDPRGFEVVETPYGRLEVLRTEDSDPIAFWTQSNLSQSWSTPLRFRSASAQPLRARVRPYRERFPLLIRISFDPKHGHQALARETERNTGRHLRLTSVTRSGKKVSFARKDQPTIEARLADGLLFFPLPWDEHPLRLRRTPHPVGFSARSSPHYRYRVPTPDEDWPTALPSRVGLQAEPLEALARELATAEPKSVYDPQVHALLVARRGTLILEEYFFGHGPERLHDTRSAGKSLTSMLAGAIAQEKGLSPKSLLDKTICELATPYRAACTGDARKSAITLGHLLSMSSGLSCDDDESRSPGNEDRMQSQSKEPDWYRYILGVPMARAPGDKAVYCTAGINLVGAGLRATARRPVTMSFDMLVARPLGIRDYDFNLQPTGEGYLGGGIRLRPRDALKLGEVMRKGGVWKGRRVLSKAWVEASSSPHASIHQPGDYGLGWWRTKKVVKGTSLDITYASGNGGQLIFWVPRLEMVVLFMGGNYGNYGTWRRFRDDYLPRILTAALPEPD